MTLKKIHPHARQLRADSSDSAPSQASARPSQCLSLNPPPIVAAEDAVALDSSGARLHPPRSAGDANERGAVVPRPAGAGGRPGGARRGGARVQALVAVDRRVAQRRQRGRVGEDACARIAGIGSTHVT
eukprot:396071-Pleurochrysis_carterae.AAC.1